MSSRLLVGTRKGLFRIQPDAGGRWRISDTWFVGDPISMVLPETSGERIHVAQDLGHFGVKMQRSEDGGESWTERPTPAYPERPEGLEDKNRMSGADVPWSTQLIWSLEQGGPDELWCGTIPGGLFRSTDGGDSWNLCRSLWDDPRRQEWFGGGFDFPGIHSICVDPRDASHVTIAISCGGVWTTRDSGDSWTLIGQGLRNAYMPPEQAHDPVVQDPHRLTPCLTKPDRQWMQHHNGIFLSDDGGENFRELTDLPLGPFGFAVAVHPTDPDTAWFVPAQKDEQRVAVDARVAVTRTRDGGDSFEVLTQGLPQEHAYDLVYRHALDVDDAGERLACGSTTGSLWVSDDQGDSWQTVGTHLPPVLCVRFER